MNKANRTKWVDSVPVEFYNKVIQKMSNTKRPVTRYISIYRYIHKRKLIRKQLTAIVLGGKP